MRRSKYVKRLTYKETKLFRQLARTGITDRSQVEKFFKINSNRLSQLENSKYIRHRNACVGGKNIQIFQLDKAGTKFCREKLGFNKIAHSQSNHMEHDLKLSYAYNSLPEKIQETWEHEREIIADIKEKNKDIDPKYQNKKGTLKTCIDARVTVNGNVVGIEIVGSSYRQEDIEMKEDIALNLAGCDSINFY
jgi:hypothetical protein